ncbi:MAG: hypothetical protein R3B40_21535 [Polyangiales bacterium]
MSPPIPPRPLWPARSARSVRGVALVRSVLLGLVMVSTLASTSPTRVRACATCSVGDRTLTSIGAAQPYRGRVRLSLGATYREDGVGTPGVDALELRELRLELGAAYSPRSWLTLTVTAPLLRRDLTFANLARDVSWNFGDMTVLARGVLFRDRALAPRHLLSVQAGLELPTARAQRDASQQVLPLELQAGSGSWDPSIGLTYAHFADPWSAYVSSVLSVPTRGFDRSRGGASLSTVVNLQVQPSAAFGIRAGALVRVDATSREGGRVEPDSGGVIAYLTMGMIASPVTDLTVQAGVSVPVLNDLRGQHREGLAVNLGVSLDL